MATLGIMTYFTNSLCRWETDSRKARSATNEEQQNEERIQFFIFINKKLAVRYQSQNLKDQRSRLEWPVSSYLYHSSILMPGILSQPHLTTFHVLSVYTVYSLKTSMIDFDQLEASSAVLLQASFICQITIKISWNIPPFVESQQ